MMQDAGSSNYGSGKFGRANGNFLLSGGMNAQKPKPTDNDNPFDSPSDNSSPSDVTSSAVSNIVSTVNTPSTASATNSSSSSSSGGIFGSILDKVKNSPLVTKTSAAMKTLL